MIHSNESAVFELVKGCVGPFRAERLFRTVHVDPALLRPVGIDVSRAELAEALNLCLFDDLLRRVPVGALYVIDRTRQGGKIVFDHGAIRSVLWESGALPSGQEAITRILEPLGYAAAETYPLDALKMTGRAWRHQDHPETIAQFFVSELHPERFSPEFQKTVTRVLSTSRDPLSTNTLATLAALRITGTVSLADAHAILPELLVAFDRQHAIPTEADYETLLEESREMAWIATEGNAFNHVTDRVEDVTAVAEEQKRQNGPLKDRVEVSASGRVMQTAFRAARVERAFVAAGGDLVLRTVPGSFFEFITRENKADGTLDLGFDTSNAQAIFKMTEAAGTAAA